MSGTSNWAIGIEEHSLLLLLLLLPLLLELTST
jgi:hypothetical protein